MENKLLKELYDYFYVRPELDEQENEVEECHKALIAALEKPERKLVLRIIDAQNYITEQTSLDSFIAGFELAWRLSIELQNDEIERPFSYRTRRMGARFVYEEETDYRQSRPVGRCVAPNCGGQENTRSTPNTRSNRAPGTASGTDRTSNATDNRDGRSRWNDS